MSIWSLCGDVSEENEPTPKDVFKLEITALREALASKDLETIRAALQKLKGSGVDIAQLFKSDSSLFQTMGSRIIRSQSITGICSLLDAIAEFDENILLAKNTAGKTMASEIASFAEHYKLPAPQKVQLERTLGEYQIFLPDNTRYTGTAL